jgi:hypothetical protein
MSVTAATAINNLLVFIVEFLYEAFGRRAAPDCTNTTLRGSFRLG